METRYSFVKRKLNDEQFMKKAGNPSLAEIAKHCDVGLRWLYKVKNGTYKQPGSDSIDRVYVYLLMSYAPVD